MYVVHHFALTTTTFFPARLLPASIPLSQSEERLTVKEGDHQYSVFTSMYLNRIITPICCHQYSASFQIKDKKGKAELEKRTCPKETCIIPQFHITWLPISNPAKESKAQKKKKKKKKKNEAVRMKKCSILMMYKKITEMLIWTKRSFIK